MKDKMTAFTLKMALFFLLASIIMLFFTAFGSAEWYVSLFTALLMTVLIVIIRLMIYFGERRK